jgi:hypothetical protein
MLTDDQEFELNAVSLSQGTSGLLPGHELAPVPCGEDPPDILARTGEHVVGIEVRRLFLDERQKKGSRQRGQMGLREAVIGRAQELHRATAHRWCTVKVYFSSSCKVRGDRLPKIPKMLAELVRSAALVEDEIREFRAEDYWGPDWPGEVDLVIATVLPGEGLPERMGNQRERLGRHYKPSAHTEGSRREGVEARIIPGGDPGPLASTGLRRKCRVKHAQASRRHGCSNVLEFL